jgi:type I restriction enzyme S subunit
MAKSASHPFVSYDALNKVSIPIPPLAEQARIAAILDQFDALTNSLTEGLPREIELRQKQYAYYRDLLFSFPKPTGNKISSEA